MANSFRFSSVKDGNHGFMHEISVDLTMSLYYIFIHMCLNIRKISTIIIISFITFLLLVSVAYANPASDCYRRPDTRLIHTSPYTFLTTFRYIIIF